MDQKMIEDVLRRMRGHSPESGDDPNFRRAVWGAIRHRRVLGEGLASDSLDTLWLAALRRLFPRAAIGGLAIAVAVAWGVATFWAPQPRQDRTATTSRVLDLGVFDPQADGLTHNKLMVSR